MWCHTTRDQITRQRVAVWIPWLLHRCFLRPEKAGDVRDGDDPSARMEEGREGASAPRTYG